MILQLGSSTEWIRVTAEYSNAVLLAVMPYISDFAKKLDVPVPQPIKTEHVVGCGIVPYRTSGSGGHDTPVGVKLTNGWSFAFAQGYVNKAESPHSYFAAQNPEDVRRFYGAVRMTREDAVQLARNTLTKLGIPLEKVFAEQEPQISPLETVGTNVIPHYRMQWITPVGSPSIEIEVNANAKRVERISLVSPNLERPPPKVNVVPPRGRGFGSYRAPEVNPEYAAKLIPIVLRAVDEYGTKLGLPVPRPLTTNHVSRFELHDNGGWPHSELELTNGWRFVYRNSMVNGYYAPDNLFNRDHRPTLVKDFLGKWNMTEQQAIELVRRTLAKLDYPTNLLCMDFKPKVTKPALPGIPRYSIYWWSENEARDDLKCKIEAEVDADRREIKSLYYDHVTYWNRPPPIDVPISPKRAEAQDVAPAFKVVTLPEPMRVAQAEVLAPRWPTDDFGVENPPPTVRTIEAFKRIRIGMSLQDVVKLCGIPDGVLGHQVVYQLNDGSSVEIRARNPSRIGSIEHKRNNNS